MPWPWLHTWDEWPAGAPITGDVQRPHVLVDGPVTAGTIQVGDGVLVLFGQAELTADAIELSAEGELDWRRGFLSTPSVRGDLNIPLDGIFEIADSATIEGTVTGSGTISWTGSLGSAKEKQILGTTGLNLANITVDAGGLAWEEREDALWVLADQPGGGGDGADDEKKGCGCDSAPGSSTLLLGWLAALATIRRRHAP